MNITHRKSKTKCN